MGLAYEGLCLHGSLGTPGRGSQPPTQPATAIHRRPSGSGSGPRRTRLFPRLSCSTADSGPMMTGQLCSAELNTRLAGWSV